MRQRGLTMAGAGLVGLLAIGLVVTWLTWSHRSQAISDCPIQLREVTAETGIDFVHTDGSSGRRYIVESMSAGIATFDYDGDGLIDIYFPNGAPLPGTKYERPPRHALYKNLGDGSFRDVTEEAGVASNAYGLGVTIGDFDNDGWQDIYLNNFGPNLLYRNNGDGTFTDVTLQAGVARGNMVGAGACFLDIDGDGLLDLYVGNYIQLDLSKHIPHMVGAFPAYPSPKEYAPVPDTLYRNRGDGTFTDVTEESGIGRYAGRAMGMVCADADNDGATDIFVLNDVQENFFFHNDGTGKFEERGLLMGLAVNGAGEVLANMGVDCGDYDNDGLLDFFSTNYQGQWPLLLRNLGHGMFEDVTRETDAGNGCLPFVNWGGGLVDLDNDGHRDLFIGNGHTEDNIEQRDSTTSYRCRNIVLQNTGAGKFVNVSDLCGVGALPPHAARGVAFDDLDNDGDIDVVVLNSRERPTLLRSMYCEQGGRNHWLDLRLHGVTTNRDGVGARVRVTAGDLVQIDEVHSGRGYQSHWGSRLHFGLGPHERVDRVEVRWIGGGTDVYENLPSDRRMTLVEGGSRADR
ncbi:MAG: CRTAC1 family protein [Planctomycetota bacterium]|nr:CRTAC1 family protein [Planctomycetota bacterium]